MEVIQSDDLLDEKVQDDKSDPVSVNLVHDTPPGSPTGLKKHDDDNDIDDNEEIILKRLEAEISSVKSEVREKENEFKLLMKSIEKMGLAGKREEHVEDDVYTMDDVENMQSMIHLLQTNLQVANLEKEKHLKTISQLEQENMRLKEENMRLLQLSPKGIGFGNNDKHSKLSEEDLLGGSILHDHLGFQKSSSDTRDPIDLFNSKTDAMKEKIQYEQNRNRELEFIVIAQKSTIENQSILLSKSEEEKKSLEKIAEKNRQNLFKLNEKFLKTKAKIDNLLIYCKLMENCSYTQQEFMVKLAEIPPTIIAYIKGESDDFSLNKNKLNQSKLYKQALEHTTASRRGSPLKARRDLEIQIPENKERVSVIAMSPEKHSRLNETVTPSQVNSPLGKKSDSSNDNVLMRKDSLNSSSIIKRDATRASTSFISQAVKHSNSLIWNLKQQPGKNLNE